MSFKQFVSGYRSFHRRYFKSGDSLYKGLVRDGQSPETLVIACSDSRTDPAIVMNSQPGDLFVVRNVAAIVPPYQADNKYHGTSAAIEFAVRGLKVKHIVVMGHSLCGGVQALSQRETFSSDYEFLPQWVDIGVPALEKVKKNMPGATAEQFLRALEREVILVSLRNLMTFPWIRTAVDNKTLDLHGWYLDIATGHLLRYDPALDQFTDIRTTEKHA
jgi:carbonic anhydrase